MKCRISKFLLIRHAESEANSGEATSDPALIAITPKGEKQALALLSQIDKPDLVIVTSFVRTRQTAEPFIGKYNPPLEEWPLHEFTYLSPTFCQNTTSKDRLPMVSEYWQKCDPDYVNGIGAESFNQFMVRVISSLKKLRNIQGSLVLIFTHGHVIRFVKQYLQMGRQNPIASMNYYRDQMLDVKIENTEIFEVTGAQIDLILE